MNKNNSIADTPVVKLNNISYQTKQGEYLVSEINFELYRSEILTIVGPNGAGKSTLLNLISGLLAPSSGQIYYSGLPLQQFSSQSRAEKIAVISQHELPDSRLRVEDYIRLGCIPYERVLSKQAIEQSVREVITLLKLEHLLHHPMDKLSGGERQKVYIARSLCQKPDVLLLDEPTNHLDPKAKGEVLSIVAGLGITVIAVLHELSLAAQLCDKILVLKDAKPIAFGTPESTLTTDVVRDVFGVDIFRFQHPEQARDIVCLDIPLSFSN